MLLNRFEYKTHMPTLLSKAQKQVTIDRANQMRFIAKIYWIAKLDNGRILKMAFSFFYHVLSNSIVPIARIC